MAKKASTKKAVKPAKKVLSAVKTAKKSAQVKAVKAQKRVGTSATAPSAHQVNSRMRVYNLTRDVPEHQYFVLANGQPVRNVAELAALLDQLEDHVFSHHVTPDKNDFHNWVKDVFDDVELARKISGIDDKKHMQLVIYRHMAGHE